jgi:hypothetical protein
LLPLALQLSRNFHQYFGADSVIGEMHSRSTQLKPNGGQPSHAVTLAVGGNLPATQAPQFPIEVSQTGVLTIRDAAGRVSTPGRGKKPLGAIFVRPMAGGTDLVVWGSNYAMLEQAARLVPMLTGTGQPDFIIVTEDARWKGVDGCYLGFFDSNWQVSRASVLP